MMTAAEIYTALHPRARAGLRQMRFTLFQPFEQSLIDHGLITKNEDGTYARTPLGDDVAAL